MITQCEIRKLYAQKKEPGISEAIELAKTFERRRCGHHPDEYPEPLSTEECLQSVVDPKGTGENKHRYVVACQDNDVRRMLRGVRGTPLIYIKRSVMILEPMADESAQVRAREERSKFRAEIKNALGKRKRDREDEGDDKGDKDEASTQAKDKKKAKGKGPKGPNPLAVKKAKKKTQEPSTQNKTQKAQEKSQEENQEQNEDGEQEKDEAEGGTEGPSKRKRKRRRKVKAPKAEESGEAPSAAPTAEVEAAEGD